MGCDIHLFAEAKKKKGIIDRLMFWKPAKWVSIDKWTKNPDFGEWEGEPEFHIEREDRFYSGGRNYNLFAALCGVRSEHFLEELFPISEPKGIPIDASQEYIKACNDYGSDGHSHSWNTLKELQEYDWKPWGETCDRFIKQVLPKMIAQGLKDTDVRIVYFFDN